MIGISEENKLRLSYGVLSDSEISGDGRLGSMMIGENKYLYATFLLENEEYSRAWTSLFREIIPSVGWEPADGYCFENYLVIHKLETREQALNSPSPATIFSLFYNGEFLTTDLSVCLDSRFDKFWEKQN